MLRNIPTDLISPPLSPVSDVSGTTNTTSVITDCANVKNVVRNGPFTPDLDHNPYALNRTMSTHAYDEIQEHEQILRELPRLLAVELPYMTSQSVIQRRLSSIPVVSPHFPRYSLINGRLTKLQLYIGVMEEPEPESRDGAMSRLQTPIGKMPPTTGGMDMMEYPM